MSAIDIESLLTEISPEAPSGEKDLKETDDPAIVNLEIMIKGTPEREFDGEIIQEAKDPNWNEVRDAAVQLLTRTHDLRVAMFLIRALLNADGLNGLKTGLALLHGLIDRFWESLYPQLDPEDNNDPTMRVNILFALSEGEDIMVPLKRITLCSSPTMGQFNYRDILIAGGKIEPTQTDKSPSPTEAAIEAAFKDTDVNTLLENKAAIGATLENLTDLKTKLAEKIGDAGVVPGFSGLYKVLKDMDAFLEKNLEGREVLQSDDPDQTGETEGVGEARPAGGGAVRRTGSGDVIRNRKDVIRQLDRICRYYQSNEPGSPVPMLLKRARQLVDKNFIEIIQDLAPDSADKIKAFISGADEDGS